LRPAASPSRPSATTISPGRSVESASRFVSRPSDATLNTAVATDARPRSTAAAAPAINSRLGTSSSAWRTDHNTPPPNMVAIQSAVIRAVPGGNQRQRSRLSASQQKTFCSA